MNGFVRVDVMKSVALETISSVVGITVVPFMNIYNKTLHLYIYVSYNWPNGWTKFADIFFEETHKYPGDNKG